MINSSTEPPNETATKNTQPLLPILPAPIILTNKFAISNAFQSPHPLSDYSKSLEPSNEAPTLDPRNVNTQGKHNNYSAKNGKHADQVLANTSARSSGADNSLFTSMLSFLAEEIRDLKNELKANKKDTNMILDQLAALQKKVNQQENNSLPSHSSPENLSYPGASTAHPPPPSQQLSHYHHQRSVPAASSSIVSQTNFGSMHIRQQILSHLPFLSAYSTYLNDPNVPFVVNDLEKPFAVLLFVSSHTKAVWNGQTPDTPPLLIHANELYCKLLGYSRVNFSISISCVPCEDQRLHIF